MANRVLWDELSVEDRTHVKKQIDKAIAYGEKYTFYNSTNDIVITTDRESAGMDIRNYSTFPRITSESVLLDKLFRFTFGKVAKDETARQWAKANTHVDGKRLVLGSDELEGLY